MVTPHNGILKEQATLYVLPWNEPQDAWLGGGKRFIVHSLVLVYKQKKGVEKNVCLWVHQYPHTTHKCISITPVCICLGALWGTHRNLVAWAASGKKAELLFTVDLLYLLNFVLCT